MGAWVAATTATGIEPAIRRNRQEKPGTTQGFLLH